MCVQLHSTMYPADHSAFPSEAVWGNSSTCPQNYTLSRGEECSTPKISVKLLLFMLRLNAVSNSRYAESLQREHAERVYWEGRAAQLLGIEGAQITPDNFARVQEGKHPLTEEKLRTRQRHNLMREGVIIGQSRTLYDGVIAAPKSVSVLSLVDEQVIDAHRHTVQALTASMEGLAATRVRRGEDHNKESNRPTGNLLYGTWYHSLSRERDPQLHSHVAVMNLTYDPVEEKWKALQALPIYQHRHVLTEQYRERMAYQVERIGYTVIDKPGREFGWEVEGISQALQERFSQRSEQRDLAIASFRESYGREPSSREVVTLVRANRDEKNYRLTPAQIREEQIECLTPSEHRQLVTLKEQAAERQAHQEKHRISLHDHVEWEPEAHRHRWNYGQPLERQKMGYG